MIHRTIMEREVWSVEAGGEFSSNERHVVVLRVWNLDTEAAEGLEVVPLSEFIEGMWTDRDVRIPSDSTETGKAYLASCWNAQFCSSRDLDVRVDRVDEEVAAAIRHVVLATLVPIGVEAARGYTGAAVEESAPAWDTRVQFQVNEMHAWQRWSSSRYEAGARRPDAESYEQPSPSSRALISMTYRDYRVNTRDAAMPAGLVEVSLDSEVFTIVVEAGSLYGQAVPASFHAVTSPQAERDRPSDQLLQHAA